MRSANRRRLLAKLTLLLVLASFSALFLAQQTSAGNDPVGDRKGVEKEGQKNSGQAEEQEPGKDRHSITFDTPPPLPREKPQMKIWSAAEIEKAMAYCDQALQNISIEAKRLPPLNDYDGCGDPAPLLVSRVMTKTGEIMTPVEISPPATLNCKMAVQTTKWLETSVQPLSMDMFNTPVVKIHNVASYHCRKRYNALQGKTSEHAFANALDISSFVLADESRISILQTWVKQPNNQQENGQHKEQKLATNGMAEKQHPLKNAISRATAAPAPGPRSTSEYKQSAESVFLKQIHKSACATFSTVLGPDSNAAHADHFHLDLGRNGRYQICE